MGTDESGSVGEHLSVQMVEVPPEKTEVSVPLPASPESSPVVESMSATIEQTGADPPPVGFWGPFPSSRTGSPSTSITYRVSRQILLHRG